MLTNPECAGNPDALAGGVADGIDFCDSAPTRASAARSSSAPSSMTDLFSGWGIRPSDWSLGVSIQQELFPRASVEVGYHRRWFTMFTTGGSVNDNQAIGPNDVAAYTITAPQRPASAQRAAARRSARSTTRTRTCSTPEPSW